MDDLKVAAAVSAVQGTLEKALVLAEKVMAINSELEKALVAAGPEGLRTLVELRRLQAQTQVQMVNGLGQDIRYAVDAASEIARDARKEYKESKRHYSAEKDALESIAKLRSDISSLRFDFDMQREHEKAKEASRTTPKTSSYRGDA